MPLELLESLARTTLPTGTQLLADIDRLRVLHAAGLITAQISDPEALVQSAVVSALTDQGRTALRQGAPGLTAAQARRLIAQARARIASAAA